MKTVSFLDNFIKQKKFESNKFTDREIDVIKKIWKDLANKSKQTEKGTGIDLDIFTTFTNIDGLIGIRLFETFDCKKNGFIDLEDFVGGLEILCFGSIECCVKFLFKLFDVNTNNKVEKDFMNIIINSIPHDFICQTNETNEPNETNTNYEYWTNNCICKDAFNLYDTNHHEYLEFEEFEKWCKSNPIVISYIKSKINFIPQSDIKRKQTVSKTDILPITMDSTNNRYESYMWKRCKKTNLKIKRYFLLYGSCLYYYKSKTDIKPKGVIFLSGSIVKPLENNLLSITELNVCTGEHHPHQIRILECETQQIRNEWTTKLQKASHIIPFESVYKLCEKIGDGATSSVFKCSRIIDEKVFAVKIISKSNLNSTDKLNFKNEISILKLVSHPNIIHMDGFFETQDKIYFVIELIEDGDLLNNIVGRKPFDDLELKKLAKTLAECLSYLHELGIVHRDIKPENILCDKHTDRLVLTDFGLSHIILPNSKLVDTCGTLDYVAPEIINSDGYGCKSDIWSLGVILYLVYYGKLPFCSDNDISTIHNIIHQEITDKLNRNIYADNLISKCLEKNPQKRISAKEILLHPFIKN